MVHPKRVSDNVEDRHTWIERCERVLEDQLHLLAQERQFIIVSLGRAYEGIVAHSEQDFARCRLNGSKNGSSRRCLAAAALAHQTKCLTFMEFKAEVVNSANVTLGLAPYP